MARAVGLWLLVLVLMPAWAVKLVGYWPFDEGTGATSADRAGTATAILRGAAWSDDARYGKALHLNGVDQYVEIPDGAWNRPAPLTLTCWFRNEGGGILLDHRRAADQPGSLAAYADGGVNGYDGARKYRETGKAPVVDDAWTFLAIVITPTEMRSYCNGLLVSAVPCAGFPKIDGRLFLGARGEPQAKFFFKGWLDDLRVYDDVLAADEVRALYTNGLIGYWTVNEGLGTTVYDYSGNGAHGTLVGGAEWDKDGVLHLDGKTGYVAIPNGPWNVAAPVTYLCWYWADNGGNVFDHGLGGAIRGAFCFSAGGRFACYDEALTDVGGAAVPGTKGRWTMAAFAISPTEIRGYADGVLKSAVPIKGFPRDNSNFYLGARGEVPDGYLAGSVREMAIFNRTLGAEEIAAIYRNYTRNVPIYAPATGLKILAVHPDKLLYRPADTGAVDVTVKNFADVPQTATLRLQLVTRLAAATEVARSEITLAARETRKLTLQAPFAGQEYGCAVRASLLQGDATFDRAEDVVSVADNPWFVSIGGSVTPGEIGRSTPAHLDEIINATRNRYANWLEIFFWAPDDWANLTPTRDEWYSGQTSYYYTKTNLKGLIDRAHAQGIKMVSYGKSTAGGPDGWELTRQRPDWFYQSTRHQPSGIYDVRMLDHWNGAAARKAGEQFDWLWLFPDCRRPDTLDFGINQIVDSATTYGWDGVRFDGHFTTSSDAVSTWNMRRLKELCWKTHPNFMLGYNYAFSPENYPQVTHEMREAMAGGGMWMQEAIKEFGYGDSLRYDHWTTSALANPAYAPHELAVSKQIYGWGGVYTGIYSLDGSPKSVYKLIYALIAGSHPDYGSQEKVPGCENWGKFMTRASAFIWHPRLRPVEQAETRATVSAPGLYWKDLMQEYVDTPTRKFTVLHLVNPSPDDLIAKTTLPAPVENVTVTLKTAPGAAATRVALIRPESEPYIVPLVASVKDGVVTVTVPKVNVWAMVVVEQAGALTVPAAPPQYTEPADPKEVEAGRRQTGTLSTDPLQPPAVGVTLGPDDQLYETDAGYNSVPAQAALDTDANNGRAQVRESGVRSVYWGRTWLGSFLPGKYRISVRVKFSDEQQPARRQSMSATVYVIADKTTTTTTSFDSDPDKAPAERRLILDGKYHDYVVQEIELKQTCMLHVIGGANAPDPVGNRFFSDHIIVAQLARYRDTQLAEWFPEQKPAGLRAPQGRRPQKVLQVRGLHWAYYGLDAVAPGAEGKYALPTKYEDLYAYDALVLTNFDLLGAGYPTRRMLRSFIEDGGRLVILGGPMSLGQGGLAGTCLEEALPFTLTEGNDAEVAPCTPPLLLGAGPGRSFADKPALFWRHEVTLRPGAYPLAYAGATPIAARQGLGRGLVTVFAGTVLGTPPAGTTPFWKTTSWGTLLQQLVLQ
jgi:hypothetical protein